MKIEHFFDQKTSTFTYLVIDTTSNKCAIIDSVLDYDMNSGRVTTDSADKVIQYIKQNKLDLEWILETHAHADHLTASSYIKKALGGKIGIGEHIKKVLEFWVPLFNTGHDTKLDGSQFDHLFRDEEVFKIGSIEVKVIHTPGHTPACLSYLMEDAVFVGDTIFMPYVGTARTDFPGGSAKTLYQSIHKLFSLKDTTRILTCHDYPPKGQNVKFMSTVAEQKLNNVMINVNVSEEEYIIARNKKDEGKKVPRLLLPSIQVNMRAGDLGEKENNGKNYIKIPINSI
ncbi:MAG: MBL fold metallo-hydrolase [Rickettsiales bacterium]|jgi:glyoxylase-like metal-dependent hydrolase (beta-lactamase superfamily II)|nr:MBL fold metallo-hydrolase [Rickettsiales bacterium]